MSKRPDAAPDPDQQPEGLTADDKAWRQAATNIEAQQPATQETQDAKSENIDVRSGLDKLPREKQLEILSSLTGQQRADRDNFIGDIPYHHLERIQAELRKAVEPGSSDEILKGLRDWEISFVLRFQTDLSKEATGQTFRFENVCPNEEITYPKEGVHSYKPGESVQGHEFAVSGNLPDGWNPSLAKELDKKRTKLYSDLVKRAIEFKKKLGVK